MGIPVERVQLTQWIQKNAVLEHSRSSGPGGQNVNKLNTRVTARLRIADIEVLGTKGRAHIRRRLGNRINTKDELVVSAQNARTQFQNRKAAVARLTALILLALRSKKKRLASAPTAVSRERRLRSKRYLAEKKRDRRSPTELD